MIEAYPLTWPVDYPRTKKTIRSRFSNKLTIASTRDRLLDELRMLKTSGVIISTNIPLRKDGLMYSNFRTDDCGVAVYFEYAKHPTVLCCDKWDRLQDNLHAIERTVNAMRQLERDGVSDMLKRAFVGFKAIPENCGTASPAWWMVLMVDSNAGKDEINTAYRKLCKQYHPDYNNDNSEQFLIIQKAYEQALAGK